MSKQYTVGGVGAQPTLDDVTRVAIGGQRVVLDSANAERIKKTSPPPKSFQAEQFDQDAANNSNGSTEAKLLSPQQCRATIIVKLLQLANGRSGIRLQVAEFLASILNTDLVPALAVSDGQDNALLRQLADLFHGFGSVLTQDNGLQSFSAAMPDQKPLLSSLERTIIQGGAAATAGIGCLAIQSAKKLLSTATATAALSYEAVGAQIKCLEAELVESQGSNAANSAADEMRGLLEGSKRVGTLKAGESDALPAAFNSVAQRLGATSECIAAAYAAVRSEIQSEALPPKGSSPGNSISPRLPTVLLELASGLLSMAADSTTRAEHVTKLLSPELQQAVGAAAQAVSESVAAAQQQLLSVGQSVLNAAAVAGQQPQGVAAALAADAACKAALQAVSLEAITAAIHLRILEGPPQQAAATTDAAGAAPAVADSSADKKAAAKKKDKKGGGGVVCGKGTAILRAAVEGTAAGSIQQGSATLPVDAAQYSAAAVKSALTAAVASLQPLDKPAGKLLDELRAVIEANQSGRKPKVPKGARDFLPLQMSIREAAFNTITSVFKRHGAVSIDTPVFELRETLMGKYGEDSKLIYDLADQGGEVLSLRYDLTVPFARYVAVNGIGNIKRYHIGKVYRRDQPQMNRGRFREFFQCDFDIAGTYPSMVPDAEVLKVLVEILTDLQLGAFEIKLNHRKILDAMMEIAGVPPQKFRAICSAIDKLDKEPWEAVRSEMIDEKGLPAEVADKIGEFVVLRGEPLALLDQLCDAKQPLSNHDSSKQALEELRTLFGFLQAMNALGPIVLDLSLARGLDYYTGLIYEAVLKGANVGSIAAGGRYDHLVGMFSSKDVPAVGVSIGIERVFAIMEAQVTERAKEQNRKLRATETQVLVASIGNNMQVKRMEIASQLWTAGIKAEFGYKANPKMGDQLNYAFDEAIPFMVLFGDEELAAGNVKIKDIDAKTEDTVPLANLVQELQQRLSITRPNPAPSQQEQPASQ